ncbi:MAG: hypothetical protein HQM12_17065 [SAR324 cluster bacterium]|nr:hypothetical protein [SAR324 cluster bacterium]
MHFRVLFLFIIFSTIVHTALAIERRNKQEKEEISYFFYPLVYQVPGLGSGDGGGATVVNLLGNGSTLSLLQIQGEIEVDSVIASDIPLFTQHLTLSMAYVDGKKGGFAFFGRGPDSPAEPEFTLKFKKSYGRAVDLGFNLFDRQLEFYGGAALAFPEIDLEQSDIGNFEDAESMTPEEQEDEIAKFVKNFLLYIDLVNLFITRQGVKLDLTDDRIDPRVGIRFLYEKYGFEGKGLKNFIVEDYSLTTYIPNDDLSSVLVANVFYSASRVTKPFTLFDSSQSFDQQVEQCVEDSKENQGNQDNPAISTETLCNGIIRGVNDFNAEGSDSNATSLGGPNRLRSYPISRFYDTYSFFAGLEYRMYFLENTTPFNFILEKGVFEAVQLALFYEIGQVSPTNDDALYRDFKYSTGIGLRFVFSSVVLRADYATGKEGEEVTVFIGYGF